MKDQDMIEIFQGIKLKKEPAGSTTIRYGDKGEIFYIILEGEASCWIPVELKKSHEITEGYLKQISQANEAPDFCYYDKDSKQRVDFETYMVMNSELRELCARYDPKTPVVEQMRLNYKCHLLKAARFSVSKAIKLVEREYALQRAREKAKF
jgi:hypothetical protein